MEITNAVPPDHPEVRVSIGADAGTGATAHVRYFRNREPLPEGRQTIYRNLCRFRTKVPQMRHWAGSSPHLKNLKEPALACAASTSFARTQCGACVDEIPRSDLRCRVARPRFCSQDPSDNQRSGRAPKGFRPRTLPQARHSKFCIVRTLQEKVKKKLT